MFISSVQVRSPILYNKSDRSCMKVDEPAIANRNTGLAKAADDVS
ncbi:hypothetical protein WKK05_28365 [Nostoc sp. UHCC 0302]